MSDRENHRGVSSSSAPQTNRYKNSKFGRIKRNRQTKKKRYCNTDPITSYGILLYSLAEENTPKFLLYQRRDNFEYMDFLRGCWGSENILPGLFSAMSHDERYRIRNYTFEELWDDLWVIHDCRIYRDGFAKAKRKYDSIHHRISQILDTTESCIQEPPWGWPKGKKNGYYENSIHCASREFQEETSIDSSLIDIVKEIPYVEDFKGSNGKFYSTHYFLAKIQHPIIPQRIDTPQCIRKSTVTEEASNVKWLTFDEALSYLNPRRQSILRSAKKQIEIDNS